MSSFCNCKSYSHFFINNISLYAIFNEQSLNDMLTNNIVSFEQLGPDMLTNNIVSFEQLGPDQPAKVYNLLRTSAKHRYIYINTQSF